MKDLIKVARKLESLGLTKESGALDVIIRKISADRVKDLKEFDDGRVEYGPPSPFDIPDSFVYTNQMYGSHDADSDIPPKFVENINVPYDTSELLEEGPMPDISPSQRTLMERLLSGATRAIGREEIASAMALEKKGLIMITNPGSQKWPKIWLGLELTELGKKLIAPKEPGRRPTGGPRSHTMHSGLAEKE